jgi:hypothetical protein
MSRTSNGYIAGIAQPNWVVRQPIRAGAGTEKKRKNAQPKELTYTLNCTNKIKGQN